MKRAIVFSLLTVMCLNTAPIAYAGDGPLCRQVFGGSILSPFPVSPQWRKTNGNLFTAVRANAPHNWAYFKKIKPQLKQLKEVFDIEGVGIGDFHILNIGDIELVNGKRKIGLIDVDDGGRTSLFADFTRAAISNQVSPYKVPLRDLWNHYLDGLKDEKFSRPKVIEDIIAKSHDEYLAEQKKYLTKMIEGNRFSDAAGVRPIAKADVLTADIFNRSRQAMAETLKGAVVYDIGYKVKDTGGSQGIPRFWFLIESNGEKSIIEFKALGAPAMDTYLKQGSQAERIQSLIDNYRPQKETFGLYKFVDSGPYQFIARERARSFLNLNPEAAADAQETQQGQDIYLYLAQRAGKWHADQGQAKALSQLLNTHEDAKFQEFEAIVNDYIKIMNAENQ